ncbi:hypothetical protein [Acidimicrobium ferrooxidans]|uniref:hypothetical protein n=1 Tax=Acidimicrobium ferrooxidans TaxID=53635 RepID=UPI00149473D7|nr:hypothetical protein [Acidimicrobium ferrooxidans]
MAGSRPGTLSIGDLEPLGDASLGDALGHQPPDECPVFHSDHPSMLGCSLFTGEIVQFSNGVDSCRGMAVPFPVDTCSRCRRKGMNETNHRALADVVRDLGPNERTLKNSPVSATHRPR